MELADYSHVDRVESGKMESPCMYKDGIYDIEVHTKGGFDKCVELMRPVFTETKNLENCHGYQPTVADYQKDNCIPFADRFQQLYGCSCVGDAIIYLINESNLKVDEPISWGDVVKINKNYAKRNIGQVLKDNENDENAYWTMSNAAVVSQFMDIDFCKDSNLLEK